MSQGVRIDKWLWAVRIFKSRSLATDFCKRGRVQIANETVKPSRPVHIGDIIVVRKPPLTFTYKVTGLLEKRGSATLAAQHVLNLTPPEEFEKVKQALESAFYIRDRGAGRPTKKERRELDNIEFPDFIDQD